jgi:endo-1,4-beta-D-glucanase Y
MWIKWTMICLWFVTGPALVLGIVASSSGRWPLWDGYASAFIDCQGRVVDHQGGDRTTSEGQAYGLFFALVANDQPRFDRLLAWTTNNLASGKLGPMLPGWLWGKSSTGTWQILDLNSASDADLWIAYTLCEAGRLWRQPRYDVLGRRMLSRIASVEVSELPGFGAMLLPGESGFHPDPDTWLLNPSYPPLPVLARLAVIDPGGPWASVAANVPLLIARSARNGFAMDWVSYSSKDGFKPASPLESPAKPGGSYDAIRVYLWAGLTDSQSKGRGQILSAIPGMAEYLGTQKIPPEQVDSSGTVVGSNAPLGFSAALLPYLRASGAKAALAAQESRVLAELNVTNHLFGQQPTYYDENLILFGMGGGGSQPVFAFGRDGKLQVNWSKR